MWRRKLPNYLTYLRIAAIPLVAGCYYFGHDAGHAAAGGFFLLAGITDYFDGMLARKWDAQSNLGRFLDPIADKLLVAAVLMVLAAKGALHGVHIIPAIAIMCREILVSGLREHLAEIKVHVPVTVLAKWKTTAQMVAMFLLLMAPVTSEWMIGNWLALLLLWLSALVTVYTGYGYMRAASEHF